MFKFLKSKKGFTLVELMIVVVIMAILVAVAVPIYSAVTKNAREKTCASNKREIISQVNGYLMGNIDGAQHNASCTFKIKSDGKKGTYESVSGDDTFLKDEAKVKSLFQELPYCPVDKNYYEVVVTAVTAGTNQDTTAKVTVTCKTADGAAGSGEAHG